MLSGFLRWRFRLGVGVLLGCVLRVFLRAVPRLLLRVLCLLRVFSLLLQLLV